MAHLTLPPAMRTVLIEHSISWPNEHWKALTRGKRSVTSVFRNIENHLLFCLATACVNVGVDLFGVKFEHCPSIKLWLNPNENSTHENSKNALAITCLRKIFTFIVYIVWLMQINCSCCVEAQHLFVSKKTSVIFLSVADRDVNQQREWLNLIWVKMCHIYTHKTKTANRHRKIRVTSFVCFAISFYLSQFCSMLCN